MSGGGDTDNWQSTTAALAYGRAAQREQLTIGVLVEAKTLAVDRLVEGLQFLG